MHILPHFRSAQQAGARALLVAVIAASGFVGALTTTMVMPQTAAAALVCPDPGTGAPKPTPAGQPPKCETPTGGTFDFPVCNPPYSRYLESYTCIAEPIDDAPPPPTPPTPPGQPAPPPVCLNPVDKFDPALQLCTHNGNPGLPQPCKAPYRQVSGYTCGTEPGNSRPPVNDDDQDTNTPQCAITGYGPIGCPIDPLVKPDGGCYVKNPFAATPADRNWHSASCSDKAFTPPPGVDCSSNATIQQQCDQSAKCNGDTCNLVGKYINPLMMIFSALVGIGVALSIIWASMQYSRSADDPKAVSEAKHRILVSLLTLGGYLLFYQFLRWVIPGNTF